MALDPHFSKEEVEETKKKIPPDNVKMRVSPKCLNCGSCVSVCPYGAIDFLEPGIFFNEKCKNCGLCAKACPVGAIFNVDDKKIKQTEMEED